MQPVTTTMASPTPPANRSTLLLNALTKSLSQTRNRISTQAPDAISTAYGDVVSFFASDDDSTGVETLVNLLMSRIDKVNEITESSLHELLKSHDLYSLLEKVEASIAAVDKSQSDFTARDEAEKQSTVEAINHAKISRVENVQGRDKKKRVLPGEYIGYHAYKLKLEHKDKLEKELEELQRENDEMNKELSELWSGWNGAVKDLEGMLEKMDEMGAK